MPDNVTLVLRGSLPGNEQFTNTLRFANGDGPYTGLNLRDFCNKALERWDEFYADLNAKCDGLVLEQVLGYVYGGGVLVEQDASDVTVTPGNAQTYVPNQCALVASLITATPGRRSRGRTYLPILNLQVQPDGRITSTVAQLVANAFGAMIEGMVADSNASPPFRLPLIVASQVAGGDRHDVTTIRVGNVIDTQRRRRESLSETYSSWSIDYPGV